MKTVTNIDGIVKTFNTDTEFLEYARMIYKENEEGNDYDSELHFMPEHIGNSLEYIHEYCGDLELIEN